MARLDQNKLRLLWSLSHEISDIVIWVQDTEIQVTAVALLRNRKSPVQKRAFCVLMTQFITWWGAVIVHAPVQCLFGQFTWSTESEHLWDNDHKSWPIKPRPLRPRQDNVMLYYSETCHVRPLPPQTTLSHQRPPTFKNHFLRVLFFLKFL